MLRGGPADLLWVRSTACNGGTCVEAAAVAGGASTALRDGKDRQTVLYFSATEWAAFLDGITAGDFDELTAR